MRRDVENDGRSFSPAAAGRSHEGDEPRPVARERGGQRPRGDLPLRAELRLGDAVHEPRDRAHHRSPGVGLHRQRRPHLRERHPPRRPQRGRARGRRGGGAPRALHDRLPRPARRRHDPVGPRAGPRGDRRARRGHAAGRRDLRHQRTQAARGRAVAPRLPRRAHRPAEPRDAHRAPRPRPRAVAPRRHARRGPLRGPRRLQARQRRLRPRGGRRAAARRRRAALRDRPRDRHGRPSGRRRVPHPPPRHRAGRGRDRRRPRDRTGRACPQRAHAAGRRRGRRRLRQREHRDRHVPRRRRHRGGSPEARRHRDVPREGVRPRRARRRQRPHRAHAASAPLRGGPPAPCAGPRRVRAALPAARAPGGRRDARRRGPHPLARPGPRARRARRVHPARRAHRARSRASPSGSSPRPVGSRAPGPRKGSSSTSRSTSRRASGA